MEALIRDTDNEQDIEQTTNSDYNESEISLQKYLKKKFREYEEGFVIEPISDITDDVFYWHVFREFPDEISKRSLEMMDHSMREIQKGNISEPIDLDELDELLD